MSDINLPMIKQEESFLTEIVECLNVPRNILADDKHIIDVWQRLPALLSEMPKEYVNPLIARMCIAVRVGLFDSAVNYIWNTTVINLRKKIIDFGLNEASDLLSIQKTLTITGITDITDAQLLSYCLSLNLITETGYFFLNQCRSIRNNYSSAHPVDTGEMLDNYGLQNYINNCIKYSFTDSIDLKGVNLKVLTDNLKTIQFLEEQLSFWYEAIKNTNEIQKTVIFVRLHNFYCDSNSSEITRLNCLNLFNQCKEFVTDTTMSNILVQHQEYVASGKEEKIKASRMFYDKTFSLKYLNDSEKNIILVGAIRGLETVHNQFNNFYNEPPFSGYLHMLTKQVGVPEILKVDFVTVIVNCSIGNGYGVSSLADIDYIEMIRGFTPAEIKIMIELPEINKYFKFKIGNYPSCLSKYKELLRMLSIDSIPKALHSKYEELIK